MSDASVAAAAKSPPPPPPSRPTRTLSVPAETATVEVSEEYWEEGQYQEDGDYCRQDEGEGGEGDECEGEGETVVEGAEPTESKPKDKGKAKADGDEECSDGGSDDDSDKPIKSTWKGDNPQKDDTDAEEEIEEEPERPSRMQQRTYIGGGWDGEKSIWQSCHSAYKVKQQYMDFVAEEAEDMTVVEADVDISATEVGKRYEILRPLGKPPFSVMKEAKDKSSGEIVALRLANLYTDPVFNMKVVKAEAELFSILKHRNIADLKALYELEDATCFVFEGLSGGELLSNLSVRSVYSPSVARKILASLLDAIRYIHEKNYIHRDIGPENIYFDSHESIKLVGLRQAIQSGSDTIKGQACGNLIFQAPEMVSREGYSKPLDMWSLGVLTYILLSGTAPFQDKNPMKLSVKIRKGQFDMTDSIWATVPEPAKSFTRQLLTVNSTDRLTVQQAIQHPWIAKGDAGDNTHLPHFQKRLKEFLSTV